MEGRTFVLTKGAMEMVLPLCDRILTGNEVKPLDEEVKATLMRYYESMMDEGLRGNVFACRSFRESVFSLGLFSNRLVVLGIAVEIILSLFIIYHPLGNSIFGTAPLSPDAWLMLIPFGIGLLVAEELRKLYVRRSSSR